MKQQINVKVDGDVAERFSSTAKGLDISQRQLFERMLSLFITYHPGSVEKGRRINEMERRIREEA